MNVIDKISHESTNGRFYNHGKQSKKLYAYCIGYIAMIGV